VAYKICHLPRFISLCTGSSVYTFNSYPSVISVPAFYMYRVFTKRREALVKLPLHIWNIKAWWWRIRFTQTCNLLITLSLFYNKSCVRPTSVLLCTSVFPFRSFFMRTDGRMDRFQLALRSDADASEKGAGCICDNNRGTDLLNIGCTAYTCEINTILHIISDSLIFSQGDHAFII
jgi:hypothetical protein